MLSAAKRRRLKDSQAESRLFNRRALLALAVVVLIIGALLGRFAWLQVVNHDDFSARSERNRVKVRALAPTRGLIFDRNGVLLADNRLSYRLDVIPERAGELAPLLDRLQGLIELSNEDRERFIELARYRRPFQSLQLRFNLSQEEQARLALDRWRLPGVEVVPVPSRHYPQGALLAHVVGYVGRANAEDQAQLDEARRGVTSHVGKTGIERQYEQMLRGELGRERVEINAEGRVLRFLDQSTPAQAGVNLYLTIDLDLQRAAAAAFGDGRGAAVAIDPRNGEVLAFVSMPSYDPNPFVNGISHAAYAALLNSKDRPLYNRALQGGYEPGSTLKPFVGLAGLAKGLRTPADTTLSTGEFTIPGQQIGFRDWRTGGHGRVDLERALAESVNSYFYQLGLDLGIDQMAESLAEFGFGSPTGIDLPGEASGILPTRQWKRQRFSQPWYPGETVIAAIGQGFNVSTIPQLAVATAALGNGGLLHQPRLLRATQARLDRPASPFQAAAPKVIGLGDESDRQAVIAGMHAVVQGATGTARAVGIDAPYQFAGKTGTAQRVSRSRDGAEQASGVRNQALFVAFAPLQDPQIAVAVVVEAGDSGSRTAAPLARKIIDAWLLREAAVGAPATLQTRRGQQGGGDAG